MDYADFLMIFLPTLAGVVAGVLTTWALRWRIYSLEDHIALLETNLTREVKARAGLVRQRGLTADEAKIQATLEAGQPPAARPGPWWMTGLPRSHNG